jgi:hypothetical protein
MSNGFNSKRIAELTVVLLWVWLFVAAFAISQRILDINVLPQNLELIAKALVANFTLIVIVTMILSLHLHITEIDSTLKQMLERSRGSQSANFHVESAPEITGTTQDSSGTERVGENGKENTRLDA